MNLETPSNPAPRNTVFRVLISIAWFFAIYEGACIVIGGIVGGLAGAPTHDYATGHEAGHAASAAFFAKYWLLVFVGAAGCTAVLSWRGILPGTGSRS
jgi:hypothetical protein